jgi:hypothetical protein
MPDIIDLDQEREARKPPPIGYYSIDYAQDVQDDAAELIEAIKSKDIAAMRMLVLRIETSIVSIVDAFKEEGVVET